MNNTVEPSAPFSRLTNTSVPVVKREPEPRQELMGVAQDEVAVEGSAPLAQSTEVEIDEPKKEISIGSGNLTVEMFQAVVPKTLRNTITPELIDKFNKLSTDPVFAEHLRDNLITYSNVIKDGKYKIEDYLHAVTFTSYKVMGETDREAYIRTFPDRYTRMVAENKTEKAISAYISIYKKGKLVVALMEQTHVAPWILNQGYYQEALNVQYDLMKNAGSEKVRTEAANSLLTHLKKPEPVKGLNLSINESNEAIKSMDALREAMNGFALAQRESIASGQRKTIDVAGEPIYKKPEEEITDV